MEAGQFREDAAEPVPLDETSYYVGRLSDDGLERLQRFIEDMTRRMPLASPAWSAHRTVLESLASDIGRERTRREQA